MNEYVFDLDDELSLMAEAGVSVEGITVTPWYKDIYPEVWRLALYAVSGIMAAVLW